jgi:hypothetical protein
MKTNIALLVASLLTAGSAQAYNIGDRLQFVGVDKNNGTCAVHFKIGPPSTYLPVGETLQEVQLYSTLDASKHFSSWPDFGDRTVFMTESFLWGRYFSSHTSNSRPEGFETRRNETSLTIYGKSLGEITHVDASDWVKFTFSSNRGGDFTCRNMRPITQEQLADVVTRIQSENTAQRAEARRLKDERIAKARKEANDATAKAHAERTLRDQKLKAEQEERERNEPIRREAIDADRKAKGLAPIDWSQAK